MFRHIGRGRTFKHNLKIATVLSFIAGIVNICGLLSVRTLTTNVTGHFAFFAADVEQKLYSQALTYLLYIVTFFFGSFVSGFATHLAIKKAYKAAHFAPMLLEVVLLSVIGLVGDYLLRSDTGTIGIALLLLFSMGLQNALVTHVSKSVVRTTHLTGLFTDLGIELSQLVVYWQRKHDAELNQRIYLRLAIIFFFFGGCVLGGYLYQFLTLQTLILPSVLLAYFLIYDMLKLNYYRRFRKIYK